LVKPIKKADTFINWENTKENIYNLVRGLDPFPGAYALLNHKRYKIYSVKKIDLNENDNYKNGEIIDLIKNEGPIVKVKNGGILIKKIKPENKKMLSGQDIINGNYIKKGEIFSNKEENV